MEVSALRLPVLVGDKQRKEHRAVEEPVAQVVGGESSAEAATNAAHEQCEADLQRIRNAMQFDGLFSLCCLFLRQHTYAKDVYIARKANNQLQYISATPESRMPGQTLAGPEEEEDADGSAAGRGDRKSTRLNSSH